MSLIKCPECKKKVSDKATACPRCGFPFDFVEQIELTEHFLPQKVAKRQFSKLLLFLIVLITLLAIASIIGLVYYIHITQTNIIESYKYPLFEHHTSIHADPYGLATDNSILGLDINEILCGYVEGVDYTHATTEYYNSYTFTQDIDYIIGTANLVIYTSAHESSVNMIQYCFRMSNPDTNSGSFSFLRLKNNLTEYYDIDPTYAYVNDDLEIVNISKEVFDTLRREDYKTFYHIDWDSKLGKAGLLIENIYEERSIDCSISFTK